MNMKLVFLLIFVYFFENKNEAVIEKVSDFSKTTCVSFSKIQEFQNLFFSKFKQRERIRIIVAKNALLQTCALTSTCSRERGHPRHQTEKLKHHGQRLGNS